MKIDRRVEKALLKQESVRKSKNLDYTGITINTNWMQEWLK